MRDEDLRLIFRKLHAALADALSNPFYTTQTVRCAGGSDVESWVLLRVEPGRAGKWVSERSAYHPCILMST